MKSGRCIQQLHDKQGRKIKHWKYSFQLSEKELLRKLQWKLINDNANLTGINLNHISLIVRN
ncbi:hypothetical protein M5K25_016703 [Dendrobium thyrsiflorum]|uniref:Mobile element protein n=1 Tax=Dendrobium thyrsiflorum TaxID=117978 RepID=A0ABD0USH1_DENTH